jgi:hypothetical protein
MSDLMRCLHATIICFPAHLLSVDTNIYGRFSFSFTYIWDTYWPHQLERTFHFVIIKLHFGLEKREVVNMTMSCEGLVDFVFLLSFSTLLLFE